MEVIIALLVVLGLLIAAGYIGLKLATLRRRRIRYPDPAALITEPDTGFELTRQNRQLLLRWPGGPVRVYAGDSPDAIDRSRPVAESAGDSLRLDMTPQRRYFELELADSQRVMVAERALPLDTVANLRDIGGYPTADGRRVRWGRVYRSGSLGHVSEADMAYLHGLGLKLVCDLRSIEETVEDRDRLPENPTPAYLHEPVFSGDNRRERLRALILAPQRLHGMLAETYRIYMIDQNAPLFAELFRQMADEANLPVLLHCTAGKDRTGVTVALLLLLLGVPDEIIVADYTLSNRYFQHFRSVIEPLIERIGWMGVTIDDLTPLLTAHPDNMREMIAYIREKHGSAEAYLREQGGLDADVIARLKATLLT